MPARGDVEDILELKIENRSARSMLQERHLQAVALHIVLRHHEQIELPEVYNGEDAWQDEAEHPLIRWQITLQIEEILTQTLPPIYRDIFAQQLIQVSHTLETLMYCVAPSLEHYRNESTLRVVTDLLIVQLAICIYHNEVPDRVICGGFYHRVVIP